MTSLAHRKEPPPKKTDNSVSLFVSLYLVVLAFFILLNSISKIEQKKHQEAMESIDRTFSNVDSLQESDLPYIEHSASFGSQIAAETFFAPVGKLAKEMLSITDANIIETGNTMVLTVPINTFYVSNSPEIQGKQRAFLNRVADEMTKMGDTSVVNLEFSVGLLVSTKMKDKTQMDKVKLGTLRAGSFARVLASMGVDERAIYVGLMPDGDPNTIQMTFTASEKPAAKQNPL